MSAPTPEWPVSWDQAREAVLDAALAATPTQRLEWLEAALKLAYDAGGFPTISRADARPARNRRDDP